MPAEPQEVHIHIHVGGDTTDSGITEILGRLTSMETLMSDTSSALSGLTAAISAATGRIDQDVAHLNELLQAALATDASDAATIAQLRADAATVVDSINAATAQLAAIDPDSSFPPAEPPPADEPPADTPPVDEPPVEPPADV